MSTEKLLSKSIILHGLDIVDRSQISEQDLKKYLDRLIEENLNYPVPKSNFDSSIWFLPEEYKKIDIEELLVNLCPPENYDRLIKELDEYRRRNLIPLLKQLKYIIDTLRKNNIIWGVGRGSSVASYVLFLLGVHKIDSVKYELPIEEFFKGEQNG